MLFKKQNKQTKQNKTKQNKTKQIKQNKTIKQTHTNKKLWTPELPMGGGHSNITVYTCVTKKTCEKGTFFTCRKARYSHDTLRMSKTVFWEEKDTFEICLSGVKGTIFFQTFLLNLYHDIRKCLRGKS